MTYAPDPLDAALEAEIRTDERHARARGVRLFTIADAIVSELASAGYLPARYTGPARVHCFSILADYLYGNASIETPRGLGHARTAAEEKRTP